MTQATVEDADQPVGQYPQRLLMALLPATERVVVASGALTDRCSKHDTRIPLVVMTATGTAQPCHTRFHVILEGRQLVVSAALGMPRRSGPVNGTARPIG